MTVLKKRNRTATKAIQIGCFNQAPSGCPGYRQAEETVVLYFADYIYDNHRGSFPDHLTTSDIAVNNICEGVTPACSTIHDLAD